MTELSSDDLGWPAPSTSPVGALSLPPEQADMLHTAEEVLTPLLGTVNYRLGGGTALAAFWRHRYSSDVDLFTDVRTYRLALGDDTRHHKEIGRRLAKSLGASSVRVGRGNMKITLDAEREISIMTTPPPPVRDDLTAGHVQESQVRLESPSIVLARKMVNRMGVNGELVGRDLYDIVAARTLAPEALALAMDVVRPEVLADAASEVRSLPAGWISTPKAGRPIKKAARPRDVASNLNLVTGQAARILANGPAPLWEEVMAARPSGLPPDIGSDLSF